ncbi:MAG: SPFH domain-containing protein, partial [Planctomycetaceae bacterium]
DSPFKSEVYFVSTRQITDLKWGTPNPIMLRDADFGPIRVRAFGNYTLKAIDARALLKELVGTDSEFETDEVTELLRSIINTAFADLIGESQVAALDLASRYREYSEELREIVCERIDDEYGLEVPQLMIVNISLPEAVEKAMDTRSSMGVIGDMGKFQQYQMGQAMLEAAENPAGGGATEGMGLGMGFAMANQMVQSGGMAMGGARTAAPPPPPMSAWHVAVNGQTQGPFNDQQMMEGIAAGRITRESQVWCNGMSGWTAAGQVPQLAAHFGAATPPPPPPA